MNVYLYETVANYNLENMHSCSMSTNDELERIGMHAGAKPRTFERAKNLRHSETPQEKVLWTYLRLHIYGFKFRRQHPFDNYILDFYCHRLRLCIEIDGLQHKYDTTTRISDGFRDDVLAEYGIKTVRISNNEIDENIDKVMDKIVEIVRERKSEIQK